MSGIYIHIPFCKNACHYCDFHFSTSLQKMPDMVQAIEKEILLQQNYLSDTINTLYFGGGTPSLLQKQDLNKLITLLTENFRIADTAEITLESNPDDITQEKADEWREAGINRVSIGIQSFFEADLRWMNRAHTAEQAKNCIEWVRGSGFENITIDLIYGSPGLTDEMWKQNIETALLFGIPHLSCYALTVEPKTALAKMIAAKKTDPVDPEKQARHFTILTSTLEEAGFEHYEISNFAKPGFRSKHNSAYWQGAHYLGLGPSAHSFNGVSRQWNIANNSLYIQSLLQGIVPFEKETLTKTQQLNEYIMTGLRTMEGVSINRIAEQWGQMIADSILHQAAQYLEQGQMVYRNPFLQLTLSGKFLADGIAADLFVTDEDFKN